MEKTVLRLLSAAVVLAAVGYGAYKIYNKYCGAKIAKQNKFRHGCDCDDWYDEDDEYLEDDDVYYFGDENADDVDLSDVDVAETMEDMNVTMTADVDEAETIADTDASEPIEDILKDN